jgi:hypothetical protein
VIERRTLLERRGVDEHECETALNRFPVDELVARTPDPDRRLGRVDYEAVDACAQSLERAWSVPVPCAAARSDTSAMVAVSITSGSSRTGSHGTGSWTLGVFDEDIVFDVAHSRNRSRRQGFLAEEELIRTDSTVFQSGVGLAFLATNNVMACADRAWWLFPRT